MDEDLEGVSLYATLASRGVTMAGATGTQIAALANSEDAELLGLEVPAPLLIERRLVTSREGTPIESTETRYAGNRFVFHIELIAQATTDRRHTPEDLLRPRRLVTGLVGSNAGTRAARATRVVEDVHVGALDDLTRLDLGSVGASHSRIAVRTPAWAGRVRRCLVFDVVWILR